MDSADLRDDEVDEKLPEDKPKQQGDPLISKEAAMKMGMGVVATAAAQKLGGWALDVFGKDDVVSEDDLQNSMVWEEVFRASSNNLTNSMQGSRSLMMSAQESSRSVLVGAYYNPGV